MLRDAKQPDSPFGGCGGHFPYGVPGMAAGQCMGMSILFEIHDCFLFSESILDKPCYE